MLVFLVDDDDEDHEIFKMAFKNVSDTSEIITAVNGIEALAYLNNNAAFKPDLIFLDINMPFMNGKECIREFKKITYLLDTPVILYSTHDGQKEVDEAKAAGASDFMTKPASIREYSNVLQTMVNKHVKSKQVDVP